MKYIHLFKTDSEFTTAYNGPDYIEPWLSLTEETMTISSNKHSVDFSTEPLTFNILSDGKINWRASSTAVTRTIKYKLNDGEWTSIKSYTGSSSPSITVTTGDKIQFKGDNTKYSTGSSVYNSFGYSTALFEVEGNIMSLIYGDDFKNNLTISSIYALASLFKGCTSLVSAENLILPVTDLANSCYYGMFQGCTKLTTAPELPATTLAYNCYSNMFSNCASLTAAPELPVTTLANYCYSNMFYGCQSLTTAPELPARTLSDYCYQDMFKGCTSLTAAPELPATTLAKSCYSNMFYGCTNLNYIKCLATNISASNCTNYWVNGVVSTGTFVKNPDMASWSTGIDGIPTGWAVQDAS